MRWLVLLAQVLFMMPYPVAAVREKGGRLKGAAKWGPDNDAYDWGEPGFVWG